MTYGYTVIYTRRSDEDGEWWSANVPDFFGLESGGPTLDGCEAAMREGLATHAETLRRRGMPIPEPKSQAAVIEIDWEPL